MGERIKQLEEELRKHQAEDIIIMEYRKAIQELEKENKKLKSDLDKFTESFKRYWDFEKQELADSLYDMEEQNKKLEEERDFFKEQAILWRKDYKNEYKKNKKLENAIEYRKKKADKNQEKANQIDKIMDLPGVMVDGKIDWSKVAFYYCI